MDVKSIIVGAIGSILAMIVAYGFSRTRAAVLLLGKSYQLARSIRKGGITRLHLSREHYESSLPTYLLRAKHSIGIVSVSLRVTHEEGNLIEIFRRRLAQDADFRIKISLMDPGAPALEVAAKALSLSSAQLAKEIRTMLDELLDFRASLPEDQRRRVDILVHDSFPMGSAVLLDADPQRGTIQVETKLFQAPRVESFGFEVVGPGSFYGRNYTAWMKVLDDSRPATKQDMS